MLPINLSFEFFPPKTDGGAVSLDQAIGDLKALAPEFVSVTYGAGGSTRDRTLGVLRDIVQRHHIPAAGHLTCVGASREEVNAVAQSYLEAGINRIVALRGDPPGAFAGRFEAHPQGYRNAAELVAGLSRIGNFEITVAAYPEKHPESANFNVDLDMLAAKADAGATRAITQFFFRNSHYHELRERIARRGIGIELVPGILPVANFTAVKRMAEQCGAEIPPEMIAHFAGTEDDHELTAERAVEYAASQLADLTANGVTSLHIYTLNKAAPSIALTQRAGIVGKAIAAA
ncbi:MAG: methylenetetrahydrofolate reductase [NAD(P)H] [Rhodobiaceae bacterium]|nr:methylenetetrahydrofolate reductase [NAD(P)H] [Rhodobiaceae bacterium]MCC0055652.1 methylenetetrahydrofolate reductase [NAD(P)H] [Rhodobiaceae bacterium]